MTEINRRTENYQPPRNATKKDTAEPKVRQPYQDKPENYSSSNTQPNVFNKPCEDLQQMDYDYTDRERVKAAIDALPALTRTVNTPEGIDQLCRDILKFHQQRT